MERLRQDLKDATLSRRISNGANLRWPSKKDRKGPNPIPFKAEISNDRRKFRSLTSDNMDMMDS